eukprot:TRINITY_DN29364_c0_g1_i1.p1 TRINITY_DN29364_c0_g1~~TRINITY_DN29364_c0_g1_i1.p1  ORF type:complete len:270 (-),score=35.46 TRINITY_DN29364_c0_g1_i1:130-939(-)
MGSLISSPMPVSTSSSARSTTFQSLLHAEEWPKSYKPRLMSSLNRQANGRGHIKKGPWLPFSKVSILSSQCADYFRELQLSGQHRIGPNTLLETAVQGTKVQLEEFRLSILQKFTNADQSEKRMIPCEGQILVSALTDFHLRSRLTMESMLGSEGSNLMFAAVASTDFQSGTSWGLAGHCKPDEKLSLSTKFVNDVYGGMRLALQAIQKLNAKDTSSLLYAITLGRQSQFTFGWTCHLKGGFEDSIDVKASCNEAGAFSVNVSTQAGRL